MKFFSQLLSVSPSTDANRINDQHELLNTIPHLINNEDTNLLMRPLTLEELKNVVFSLPHEKVPGLNGFTALFFQKFWEFLCFELLWTLKESRRTGTMFRKFNVTNIAILPKVKEPKMFVEFRPISLCDTIYKIFTKAIYLRL